MPQFLQTVGLTRTVLLAFDDAVLPSFHATVINWAAPDGNRLLVITEEGSWKVKRIRNTPRVTLAICDMRGNPKSDALEAKAIILDKTQTALVYDAIGKRYGLVGKVFNLFSKYLRNGMQKNVGLELTAA